MKAYLATYGKEELEDAFLVEIDDDYDGNPYGDYVPFAVGSNQTIVTEDDGRWDMCKSLYENYNI